MGQKDCQRLLTLPVLGPLGVRKTRGLVPLDDGPSFLNDERPRGPEVHVEVVTETDNGLSPASVDTDTVVGGPRETEVYHLLPWNLGPGPRRSRRGRTYRVTVVRCRTKKRVISSDLSGPLSWERRDRRGWLGAWVILPFTAVELGDTPFLRFHKSVHCK